MRLIKALGSDDKPLWLAVDHIVAVMPGPKGGSIIRVDSAGISYEVLEEPGEIVDLMCLTSRR